MTATLISAGHLPAGAQSAAGPVIVRPPGEPDAGGGRTAAGGVAGPDMTVTKSHSGNFTVGLTGTYAFTVQNVGDVASSGPVTVIDTLPPGLQFVSSVGVGWNIPAPTNNVILASRISPFGPGTSVGFTIRVFVLASAFPGVINKADVVNVGDVNSANNIDRDTTIVIGAPDLALDKSHSGAFIVGQSGTYTFQITNVGTGPTTGTIAVIDSLPDGMTFLGGSGTGWSFFPSGQVLTALLPTGTPIPAGQGSSFEIGVAIAPETAPLATNIARVQTAGDQVSANNRDEDPTVIIPASDLALAKRHDATFVVGSTGRYTFTVRNGGGTATTGLVTVRDTLPDGLTFDVGAGAGWSFAESGPVVIATRTDPIAAGDSSIFTLDVDVDTEAIPSVINTAVVSTDDDANVADNRAIDPTAVTGEPDLSIEKRHLAELTVSEPATYEILVRSIGSAPVQGRIIVTDELPAGIQFVSAGGAGWNFARAGQTVTATHAGPLDPGNSLLFTLSTLVLPEAVPVVFNTADVELANDPTPENNSSADVAFVTGLGSLVVGLTADQLEVELGDPVDWTLTVVDPEEGPVPDVVASLTLPVGFHYESGSTRRGGVPTADPIAANLGAVAPRVLDFSLGDLAAGATAIVTFRTRTGASATTSRNTATATARTDAGAAFTVTSNTASARVRVRGGAFSEEGVIAGSVTADGGDRLGVPGVRIALEDGTTAITDAEGRYHFPDVRPRLHVLRVDPASIPTGARLLERSVRDAGNPGSRFADVKSGEMHRADFTISSSPEVLEQVRKLRDRANAGPAAAENPPAHAPTPSILTGVIEGRVDFRDLTDAELGGSRRDRFEDELHDLSGGAEDGTTTGKGRAALYAKGALGSTQMTLRYDSEHDADARLFRDIRPLEGYDTYGDASEREHDAQSTSRLFARVERGASFAQLGDYLTPANPARTVGAFTRSLNGGMGSLTAGPLTVGGFASEGHSRQVVDEFRGLGTSGPYVLSRVDGTLGSERVEVLVRDRDRPARVLRREPLARYADYVLEPFTGRLLMHRPVPAFDEHLNPVSLRVTYETETDGEEFKVYGADGRIVLGSLTAVAADLAGGSATDSSGVRQDAILGWSGKTKTEGWRTEFGGSASRDEDPAAPLALFSGDVTMHVGSAFSLLAEIAHSDSAGDGFGSGDLQGTASRAEMRIGADWLDARVHGTRVERQFLNPSAGELRGRQELGFFARTPIGLRSSLFAEGLQTEDLVTYGRRQGVQGGLTRLSRRGVETEIAYRWARETETPASFETSTRRATPVTTNSARGRVAAELPGWRRVTLIGELEQDLNESERRRLLVGTDLRVTEATRLYARHENIASFAGPWAMNSRQQGATTVIGFAGDSRSGLHAFSEYREQGAFGGEETQAAMGLRNRWTPRRGLHLDGSLERVTAIRGPRAEATAVTGAIEYTASRVWKGSSRAEFRSQANVENWLFASGLARRFGRDWAGLLRSTWFTTPDEDRLDTRSQAGLAWRQTGGTWNALTRYEHRHDRSELGQAKRRTAHVTSTHVNWQPVGPLVLNGRLATKWAQDLRGDLRSISETKLVQGRGTLDLGRRFDLGVIGRGLFGDAGETRLLGTGVEAGAVVVRNLRLYAGYNVFGFHDEDLSDERTDRGPYVGFGLKIDEKLFGFGGDDAANASR